ncbi:MAG: ATP-binding protein [Candidatus Nitrosocosmicus sp.]|nr:ATP-binding protein [Candidatus Nitrosocosmicus sp.]
MASSRNNNNYSHFSKSISAFLDFMTNPTFLFYTILPTIPLLFLAVLSADPYLWVGSEIHHFYIELFAVVFSAVIGFYYILHARNLNDRFSLFIGIGFSASAALDLFHVIISYSMMENVEFLKYFIPQTWFAGRIFLSIMLLIGIAKYSYFLPPVTKDKSKWDMTSTPDRIRQISLKDERSNNKKQVLDFLVNKIPYLKIETMQKNLLIYVVILASLATIVAYTSLFVIYPASFLDDYSLHRPYEIPPLILFSIALVLFYKKKLYLKKDVIYKGILVYLIVDIFSQVIMSYSTAPFDTAHNMAHVLKNIGYFVNIIALALSGIQYTVALRERNKTIQSQYEKIKYSEKIKDEFINIAAHELRTPIQPILALSLFLSDKKGTLEEYKDHIDIIAKSSKRLQKLAEEILDASKIESHSLNLDIERFDLVEVICNLLREYHSSHNGNNNNGDDSNLSIKFTYKGKEIIPSFDSYNGNNNNNETIFIHADKNRIARVLSNLLSNAIKFTTKGKIDIIVQNDNDGYITIKIRDYGTGIDKDILPRLFDKFVTGSASGTGLGLYICKNIIETHGGKIWTGYNQGTTFTFTLPISNHKMS